MRLKQLEISLAVSWILSCFETLRDCRFKVARDTMEVLVNVEELCISDASDIALATVVLNILNRSYWRHPVSSKRGTENRDQSLLSARSRDWWSQ